MRNATLSRREFLRTCLGAAALSSPLASTLGWLSAAQAAPPQNDEYRALVCIFLAGGNDAFNMLVPTTTADYDRYAAIRPTIKINHDQLHPLNGVGYGFHPEAPALAQLFNDNKLAILANVGPLIEPVTPNSMADHTAALPPQLFSHNDQQRLWMTGDATGGLSTGWGGRLADRLGTLNAAQLPNMNFNFGSVNTFQSGDFSEQFGLDQYGVRLLSGETRTQGQRSFPRYQALYAIAQNNPHLFVKEYAALQQRSYASSKHIYDALQQIGEPSVSFTDYNYGTFAAKLKTTARMIAARSLLGAKRQIYFIVSGGWDTHAGQLAQHANLLQELSGNLSEFQTALESYGVAQQVTTFTMSDFGRTLTSNGDGTDHGWGGHALIMGQAVDGGKIYGQMPDYQLGGANDGGKGRIIPSTSTDQYAATLARWIGISDAQMPDVFPNLSNFPSSDLGFFI